jgi:hypothetical protein
MDPKELRGLYEAYSEVYAPQQIDEAVKGEPSERRKALAAERRSGVKPLPTKEGEKYASHKLAQMAYAKRKRMGEERDVFDTVLEFLQAEGFAETLEEAEWLMANMIDEEAIDIILELTGGKGHPGYKAGSRDLGPMQAGHPADSRKRQVKGGTMSQRHGFHLGDIDDDDDDEDDYESIVKQQSRDKRETVRKPLRNKVKAARKVLSKEEYEQLLNELSNRKLRAYIKKSGKSHAEINKKWDQGTATDKEKSKSIGHEIGQQRAFKTLDKRSGK